MNGLGWPPGSILKHWIDAATNWPPDQHAADDVIEAIFRQRR